MNHPYLQRCCDLANLATASVSPNPRVGAVLVHHGRIIGEGYHHQHGSAHAEVNCLAAVTSNDRHLIPASTLYVSLEPCCFHGRTPACTDLIIKNKIPRVVVGQRDQTATVSGQGIALLIAAGVEVTEVADFLPAQRIAEARQLFAASRRPFYLLKYARSSDGFLAPLPARDYWITNSISRRLVHFWRSRTNAILVGAGTVLADNPRLDLRMYPGPSPLPVIIDPIGKIKHTNYRVFHREDGVKPLLFQPTTSPTLLAAQQILLDFPSFPSLENGTLNVYLTNQEDLRSSKDFSPPATSSNDELTAGGSSSKVMEGSAVDGVQEFQRSARSLIAIISEALYQRNINHATVEGGNWLLNVFLAAQSWDEARVFTARGNYFKAGLPAPLPLGMINQHINVVSDELSQFYPVKLD